MIVRIGEGTLATAFRWPSGTAAEVLAATDGAMGAVRARIAATLGSPDPFHVRSALLADPSARVETVESVESPTGGGAPEHDQVTRDAADAALIGCPAMVGVMAFQPLGPLARAVVPQPEWAWLRWRRSSPEGGPGPLRLGAPRVYSAADLGDDARATFRCIASLPRGGVAVGSDYGLAILSGRGGQGVFAKFPWPAGARRENRRVEAMLGTDERLIVATQQAVFTWDYRGEPRAQKHPADADGGYDDLLALANGKRGPLWAWRTRLEGGRGPADVLAFASDPHGVTYAGTRTGEVWVVDGGGPIRRFASDRVLRVGDLQAVESTGRPVRHLAWADGHLWAAADGQLHRFDGVSWSAEPGEPGALATDEAGRLWMVRDGRVLVRDGLEARGDRVVETGVQRPWALLAVPGAIWVGGVGAVGRVPVT
ncbi:MAG: hypothetical protein EXR69_12750 [Myxococcales bacterium]|nr:hypothetical protein [Myxococcales bacterium]